MASYAVDGFRAGTVLEHALRVLGRNFVSFSFMVILLYAASAVVESVLWSLVPAAEIEAGGGSRSAVFGFAASLIVLLMMYLLVAAATYGTYREMRGQPAGPVECMTHGLSLVLPVFGVALLSGLLIAFGFLLFVIPGIFAYTILWVAVPVAVVERPGLIGSLERSRALTDGHRLHVFALLLVLGLVQLGPAWLLMQVVDAGSPAYAFGEAVLGCVGMLLGAVLPAVGYFHLRRVKDGVGVEELAAVFD